MIKMELASHMGKGRNTTEFTMAKSAALAAMQTEKVRSTVTAKPLSRHKERTPYFKSRRNASMIGCLRSGRVQCCHNLKRAGRLGFSTPRRRAKFPYVCWLGQGHASSGASFVDHFFPNAFGLEDEFDEFASGAFAAIGFRGVVGGAADFGRGVVNGDSQPDAAHDGEVGQVITEKGDFGFLGAGLAQDVFVGGDFVSLLLIDEFDVEFFAPAPEGRAAPSSDHAGAQTGSDGEREALAVVGVKRLDLKGVSVPWRRQRVAAVGERAVDVHQHDKNLLRAFRESWWDFSSS